MRSSPPTYKALDAGQEEPRVVRDSVREDDLDVVNVTNVLIRSTPDDLQIGFFAYGDAACAVLDTEERSSAERRHADGLERAESNPDGPFDAVMVGDSRHASFSEVVRIQPIQGGRRHERMRESVALTFAAPPDCGRKSPLHQPPPTARARTSPAAPDAGGRLIWREREASGDRCERQNDVSLNQQPNETLRARSLGISAEILFGHPRARPESVLEIVDFELGGFAHVTEPR